PAPPAPTTPPPPPAAEPEPEPEPRPEPPASDPYGLGTGSQRGSAGQGQAAVEWAMGKVGTPYLWGGTGPDGYDCSGLTSQAWKAAGLSINRTSRDQYKQVRKIAYDQLRAGDLIFYGRGNDPTSITHVAMYVGGGQMVEASRPGVPVRVTSVRWSGTMPFAGRP
ncbi:C40 family peptidase, partial [Cellulomonas carbonis]